jgi:ribosomal protein L16/L10AE
MSSLDALLAERRVSLLQSLRNDSSFVLPGTNHFAAAAKLLEARQAVHVHETNRLRRQQIERARHHVNEHLIANLRRPVVEYAAPRHDDEL